ncbi:MAG: hypothetical protein K0R27_2590 [Xanthobacteraceae bacterium]|nr:hypothetical protein [Xanthobacteraceae bacterium]
MTQFSLDQAPAPAASPENAGVSFIFEPIAPDVLSFAWQGTVVATISPPAAEVALLDDADGRFAVDGLNIVVADGAKLDCRDAAAHDVVASVDGSPQTISVTILPPWMAAGTGLFVPQYVTPAATSTTRSVASRVPVWIAGHGARKLRLFFPNFAVWNDGRAAPEVAGASDLTIDGAAVLVGSTYHAVSFNGAPSVVISAGTAGVWGEVAVKVRPRSKIWAITLCTVAQGATRPGTYRPDQLGSDYGGAYSAAPNLNYLNGAAVLPSGGVTGATGQFLYCYGPATIIEHGKWDGREAFCLVGDSIGVDGWPVYLIRESDRSAGMGLINLAVPGIGSWNTISLDPVGASTYWRHQMVRSAPNRPHTRVLSQVGVNDKHPNLATWRAREDAWWAFLKQHEGFGRDVPLDQGTYTPRAQSVGNWRWTNQEQMTFNETSDGPGLDVSRWQMVDYIRTVPAPLASILDVTPSFVGPEPYQDRWTVAFATTLRADASIGATMVKLDAPVPLPPGAPSVSVVFEGGAANWEQRNASSSVPDGAGGYDVTLTSALTKAHLASTSMHVIATTDGTHPVRHLAIAAAADQVDAVKRDQNGIYVAEVDTLAWKTSPLLDTLDPGGVYAPGIGRISSRTFDLVDAMEAAGEVPPNARILNMDAAMRNLFAKGVLDRFDALHFLFAQGPQSSLLNWCDPARFNLTVSGAPTFTVDAGWNGASGGLLSITPSNPALDRYSLDDASIVIMPTVSGTGNNVVEATGGSPLSVIFRHGGSRLFRINDSSNAELMGSGGTAGHYSMERSGTNKRAYYNLALVRDVVRSPVGLASVPLQIRTLNTVVPSFFAVGAALNDTIRADLKATVDTYLAAIAAEA